MSFDEKHIPEEFKKLAKDFSDDGFITTSFDNLINWARALYKMSIINVLLPDPETPVTHIKQPSGMRTLMSFRLFCSAPFISRK